MCYRHGVTTAHSTSDQILPELAVLNVEAAWPRGQYFVLALGGTEFVSPSACTSLVLRQNFFFLMPCYCSVTKGTNSRLNWQSRGFFQVIQFSPLSSKIQFPYILSSLFFLADPSAVYGNLIHFCPERYSSTSYRLGNWSHTSCRFVYAEKRVGA